MDLRRLLRGGAKGMGIGTALVGATAAGLWWQLFRRPLPRHPGGDRASAGLDGRVEIARDRWGMPTVRAQTRRRPLVRAGLLPRAGPALAGRHPAPDLLRPALRGRRARRLAGRPPDADARPAPGGAARGGRAGPRSSPAARRLLRRAQPGGRDRLGAARPSSSCCASSSSRGAPPTCSPEASCSRSGSRPTGSGSCCAPTSSASSARSAPRGSTPPTRRGTRSCCSPGRDSTATASRLAEQIGRVRDQIGLAAAASGSNNWTVSAEPLVDRRGPARRRSASAQRDAGRLVRDRPRARRPDLPRRLDPGAARDLPRSEQRRRLRLHQRDGGRRGPLRRANRGRELRVRGRAAAAGDRRGADHDPRRRISRSATRSASLITARSSTRLSARTTSSLWPCAGPPSTSPRSPTRTSACSEPTQRAGAGRAASGGHDAGLESGLGRPARIDRLQDDGPDPEAEGRLPGPAEAGLDWRVRMGGLDPLRRAARAGRSGGGLHRHGEQPGRRRLLSPPHHQRLAGRLSGGADRAAARARREEHDLDSFRRMQTDLYSIPGDEVVHRLARLEPTSPARDQGDRAPEELGPHARAADRRRARSTRPSCFAWRGSSPARRSATETSPSATSTAPTTGSSRTSPRPGAGRRTCWTSGRRATTS